MKFESGALLLSVLCTAVGARVITRQHVHVPTVLDPVSNITYAGTSSHGVESFLNIRFGQDTGGANRFKAPRPYTYSANTVVNASLAGAVCPQQMVPVEGLVLFDNVTDISEDCLTLRIDRPSNTSSDAMLPVMVWIYGGGFNIGQIYDSPYDPTLLVGGAAQDAQPIIYVAISYRIGIFGFASTPAMSLDDLNAGLLDQRLGLTWVRQNIRSFGGDPDKITVFGESAGGDSIGLHLVSYAGNTSMQPPFSRAIIQSGGVTSQFGMTGNQTANNTALAVDRMNCTSSSGNYSAELDCLRTAPLDILLATVVNYSLALNPLGGFNTFSPVVPSTIIPAAPSVLLSTGQFHQNVSLISGWTENDGSLFVPSPSRLTTEDDLTAWLHGTTNLSDSAVQEILTLYPETSFADFPQENVSANWFRASQIERDRSQVCTALLLHSAIANTSGAASTTPTTNYLYAFNASLFTSYFTAQRSLYLGVPHFSDIGFVFNQAAYPAYNASEANIRLSTEVSGSWASFAATGNPRGNPTATADGAINKTVAVWTQGATANTTSTYGVRILGGPNAGMAVIDDAGGEIDSGKVGRGHYDQDVLRRCQFWNSMEVLEMNGT